MLCNRYRLPERLGKYFVSICSKYSNIYSFLFSLSHLRQHFQKAQFLMKQREVSLISHEVIHNVFELVDPHFISCKPFNAELTDENSLGKANL